MSKINKIRFINVNYNNNRNIIDDETFYFGGESTLLSLRNGGGKSVLVQMAMAPFMNKRKRDIEKRTFDGYFTVNKPPTYILIEWALDDSSGYLLTGMMVRKRANISDEDSKDKLEVINFVHEYEENNQYDIDNIPFIIKKNDSRSIREFLSSKKIFEDLKKDKNYKFNYYDMSYRSKVYFEKLKEYKINNKEWENIIRKINLKESGLSELFAKEKSESSLIKEWIIPIVEEKLNNEENRVEKYREIIKSYIIQYKTNQNSIQTKKKIEIFLDLAKEIKEKALEFKDIKEEKLELENSIANLREQIIKEMEVVDDKILDFQNEDIKLRELFDKLIFEEISKEIYENKDKLTNKQNKLNEKNREIEEANKALEESKKKKQILECSEIYEEYTHCSKEVQVVENEIKALGKTKGEKESLINDLGYSIKRIIEEEKAKIENALNEYNSEILDLKNDEKLNNQAKLKLNKNLIELNSEKGGLDALVKQFLVDEEKINSNNSINLNKNIEGYYKEEDIELYKNNLNQTIEKVSKSIKLNLENLIKKEDEINTIQSEKEKSSEEYQRIKINLKNQKERLEENEIKLERILENIRIIDFDKGRKFEIKEIEAEFNKKIQESRIKINKNTRKIEEIKSEISKLKDGKIIEIPLEVQNEIENLGIPILYGMEWLNNNKYSEEKNKELVRKNKFIPYSLIMNDTEIMNLNKSLNENTKIKELDNFIIPIIKKQNIEDAMESRDYIINESINFYIGFNEGLLEKDKLNKILEDKKLDVDRLNNSNTEFESEIKIFEGKLREVISSNITKKGYEELKANILNLQKEEEIYSTKEKEVIGALIKSKSDKKNLEVLINEEKENERNLKEKKKVFEDLISRYKDYIKHKSRLENLEKDIEKNEKEIKIIEDKLKNIHKLISLKQDVVSDYKFKEKGLKEEEIEYINYENGNQIKKDKEDLVSEYRALTKTISESEKELKNRLDKANKKYKDVEDKLIKRSKYYEIQDNEYMQVKYSEEKSIETDEEITRIEKEKELLNKEKSELEKEKTKLEIKIESLYKDLKEKLNKEEALNKEEVFDKNFKEEKAKINISIKNNKKYIEIEEKKKRTLENNKTNLSEYSDLQIKENIEIKIDYSTLDEVVGKHKRDDKNIERAIVKGKDSLLQEIENIKSNNELRDFEEFITPLNTMIGVIENPRDVLEFLNTIVGANELNLKKIITDLKLIDEEEENIIVSLLEYVKEINDNIKIIDENSSIKINGKNKKMLEIIVENFEENKENYKLKVKDYLSEIRNGGINRLDKNENVEDFISKKVTSYNIYNDIININSIKIKLYKIEENRQIKIIWSDVSKNSGGEGFLSAFIILTSLLSYMGKDESDIFSHKISGKVLIMDNPFAQTNASHLLKPLMDIAKKSNTQLICLSGLGGDSIYGRFENIYVLNLIESKLYNKSFLKINHIKGEEEKDILVGARFNIEDSEQVRLF